MSIFATEMCMCTNNAQNRIDVHLAQHIKPTIHN